MSTNVSDDNGDDHQGGRSYIDSYRESQEVGHGENGLHAAPSAESEDIDLIEVDDESSSSSSSHHPYRNALPPIFDPMMDRSFTRDAAETDVKNDRKELQRRYGIAFCAALLLVGIVVVLLVVLLRRSQQHTNVPPTWRDMNVSPPLLSLQYANARYGEHVVLTRDGQQLFFTSYNAKGQLQVEQYELDNDTDWQLKSSFSSDSAPGMHFNSVAVSGDGHTVAMSLYPAGETEFGGPEPRLVQIWKRQQQHDSDSSTWFTTSKDILNETSMNLQEYANLFSFGETLSLNHDGTVLAVGAPTASYGDATNASLFRHGAVQVYALHPTTGLYEPRGRVLIGGENDYLGTAAVLSAHGDRLVVGASRRGSDVGGYVQIYDFDGQTWQLMTTLNGADQGTFYGGSLALTSSGHAMAVGAYAVESLEFANSTLEVFEIVAKNNTTNTSVMLQRVGQALPGGSDGVGYAMSLSDDARTWAVNDVHGVVRVYRLVRHANDGASSWSLLGSELGGNSLAYRPRNPVSLSGLGDRVAFGLPDRSNSARAGKSGDVQVHQLE